MKHYGIKFIHFMLSMALSPLVVQPLLAQDSSKTIADLVNLAESGSLSRISFSQTGKTHAELITALNAYMLDEKQEPTRMWFAAITLAKMGDSAAATPLLQGLQHPAFNVRMASIKALELMVSQQLIPLSRIIEPFHLCLNDKAMVVRAAAAESLGNLHSQASLPLLLKEFSRAENFYRGKSLPIRKRIIVAINKIGGMQTMLPMTLALSDTDPEVAQYAFFALNPLLPAEFEISQMPTATLQTAWQTILQNQRETTLTTSTP